MRHLKLPDHQSYNGSQIEPMWAFRQFQIKESNIVTWIGPMKIKTSKIIDYEDLNLEIKADEMIHFIIEHFDCQPADIRICYHRQRLFVTIVKDLLAEQGIVTERDGDDLYFQDKKLNVSVATCSQNCMKIHFGMNLKSEGTPKDVATVGLLECRIRLDKEEVQDLIDQICKGYIREISSIEKDIAKTKVF